MTTTSHVSYRIRRTLVWIRRWRRTGGFGVQSPTDFHFVRCVINDHRHHADYDIMTQNMPHTDRKTRKVCRLYYRIARWRQPDEALLCDMPDEAYHKYVAQGNPNTHIITTTTHTIGTDTAQAQLIAFQIDDQAAPLIARAAEQAADNTVIIVNGIHRTRHDKALWKQLLHGPHATLTFDVYYCGIIIKDSRRSKQHYIVNY